MKLEKLVAVGEIASGLGLEGATFCLSKEYFPFILKKISEGGYDVPLYYASFFIAATLSVGIAAAGAYIIYDGIRSLKR